MQALEVLATQDLCLRCIKCVMHFFESYLLKVQNNISHVFYYALDGREFMYHSWDFDRSDGVSLQRRKQYSSESVTDGNSIAFF